MSDMLEDKNNTVSIEEIDSSSKKISELSVLSSLPDDAMLVAENHTTSASYKVKFSDLKTAAIAQLSAQMKLSSMAYKDKNDYAPAAHGHNFTDFWFYPSYGPDSNNEQYKDPASCNVYGRFDIVKYGPDTEKTMTSISVCSPQISADIDSLLRNPVKVGDLQMLAIDCTFEHYLTAYRGYKLKKYADGISNVIINSDTFDGYVIPNGTTFACKNNEFKEACTLYGSGPTAQSFTVPCLSSFFKSFNNRILVEGCRTEDIPLHYVKYHNALLSHTHTLETSLKDRELTCNLKDFIMPTSDPPRKKPYNIQANTKFLHGGHGEKSGNSINVKLTSAKMDGAVTSVAVSSSGKDEESYPKNVVIPVLLYIGSRV